LQTLVITMSDLAAQYVDLLGVRFERSDVAARTCEQSRPSCPEGSAYAAVETTAEKRLGSNRIIKRTVQQEGLVPSPVEPEGGTGEYLKVVGD
jgi:hypothetical protein